METANNNTSTSQVDFSNIFTFQQIMTMPVKAIIKANIDASITTFDFIKRYGFEEDPDGNSGRLGKPKMLEFTYRFSNGGVEQKMRVSIPILSLLSLPFLTVRKAKFDVGLNILNHMIWDKSPPPSQPGIPPFPLEDPPIPILQRETLVMLGPIEPSGLRRLPSAENSNFFEGIFATNMQASIEVESSDFPSGVLKLLNLFQDAVSGEGQNIYTLHSEESNIYFDPTNNEISLKVHLFRNQDPIENEIITATIASETDPQLNQTFAAPISVVKGNVVGNPALDSARALSDKNGIVEFKFTAIKTTLNEHNGFIFFNTARAQKIAIYYKLLKPNYYES